jgi:hypothetical protein
VFRARAWVPLKIGPWLSPSCLACACLGSFREDVSPAAGGFSWRRVTIPMVMTIRSGTRPGAVGFVSGRARLSLGFVSFREPMPGPSGSFREGRPGALASFGWRDPRRPERLMTWPLPLQLARPAQVWLRSGREGLTAEADDDLFGVIGFVRVMGMVDVGFVSVSGRRGIGFVRGGSWVPRAPSSEPVKAAAGPTRVEDNPWHTAPLQVARSVQVWLRSGGGRGRCRVRFGRRSRPDRFVSGRGRRARRVARGIFPSERVPVGSVGRGCHERPLRGLCE